MKMLFATAAVSSLLMTMSVVAQTTTPAPTKPSTPAPSTSTPSTSSPMAPRAGNTAPGELQYFSKYSDEMRSSKLIGTSVRNAAGESIGDINEILIDKSGKVAAVVVGVGGFLGMGEREVALQFESIKMTRDANGNNVFTVNATKDTLKNAPAWTWPRT